MIYFKPKSIIEFVSNKYQLALKRIYSHVDLCYQCDNVCLYN